MKDKEELVIRISVILLVIFGIFISYQIIRKMLGGSWTTEDIVVSLLIFNLGAVLTIGLTIFTTGLTLARLKSDHTNLARQFSALAGDFKDHIKK